MTSPIDRETEWLEADGLGGFASGTTDGVNTRRYHALLLVAEAPPANRRVLVNDAAVWLRTPEGVRRLSRHSYAPDVVTERDARLVGFRAEPWPQFTYEVDGLTIEHELVALHGLPVVLSSYRISRAMPGWTLCVRPLLSGRDFHSLHRENGAFDFAARNVGERCAFRPYSSVTGVLSLASAKFVVAPDWYRNFSYAKERERGLAHVEDLGSPGVLEFDLAVRSSDWVLGADTAEVRAFVGDRSAEEVAGEVRTRELARRSRFPTPLDRAADAYVVKRGEGRTVIAGYPWFGDWGRDTFIALRGLCLATERCDDARAILLAWSAVVSGGMLPNRFADRADEEPEYNSVDAALWYVVAVGELLMDAPGAVNAEDRAALVASVRSVVEGYLLGTRHGIRADTDGLLAAGAPGVQLTWMDAKIGDWVVTPRIGKPVEIQALWLNALHAAETLTGEYGFVLRRGIQSFEVRFFNEATGCLFDVVDDAHISGKTDGRIRPNQIFALGGLPLTVFPAARCRAALDVVERALWTPLGPRSLAPGEPGYRARYAGGVLERDSAYHEGTVWPWLAGPFIEAWVKARGATPAAKREARERFYAPLVAHLEHAGVGHVSEVADGDAPHTPGGCPFQAWSVAELLRLDRRVLAVDRGEKAHAAAQ